MRQSTLKVTVTTFGSSTPVELNFQTRKKCICGRRIAIIAECQLPIM